MTKQEKETIIKEIKALDNKIHLWVVQKIALFIELKGGIPFEIFDVRTFIKEMKIDESKLDSDALILYIMNLFITEEIEKAND